MAGSAWTNQVQNQVIIAGTSGQLLVYSGTPAFGNLISSISARAFTDPYGNAVLAGVTDYFKGVTYSAVQMNAGAIFWYTAGTEAGPWTAVSEIVQNLAGTVLTLIAPSLTISGPVNTITAVQPNTVTTSETWHTLTLTTVTASGNGVSGFRYKLMPFNCLLLEWDLATNSVGNSVTIATLPAGWRPATAHNIATGTYGGATAITTGANPHFAVNTDGTIVTGGFPAVAFDVCGTALIGLD